MERRKAKKNWGGLRSGEETRVRGQEYLATCVPGPSFRVGARISSLQSSTVCWHFEAEDRAWHVLDGVSSPARRTDSTVQPKQSSRLLHPLPAKFPGSPHVQRKDRRPSTMIFRLTGPLVPAEYAVDGSGSFLWSVKYLSVSCLLRLAAEYKIASHPTFRRILVAFALSICLGL